MPNPLFMAIQPVRPISDYQAEMAATKTREQQNALVQLGMDEKRAAMQTTADDRNALQRIAAGWTPQTTSADRIAALRNSGRPALSDYADTLEKQTADIGKTQAETQSKQIENQRKLLIYTIQGLQAATTPERAALVIQKGVQDGAWGMDHAQMLMQELQAAPDFNAWRMNELRQILDAEKQLPKIETRNLGGTTQTAAIDPLSGQVRVTNAVQNTQSPDSAASVAVQMRGQNMADARARETASQGKIPAGYRQTADGNLEAIKGGPADTKMQGVLNADTQTLTSTASSLDRLATSANEVLNAPGLDGVYGLRGAVPNIPGSEAANAAALLNTLKSQVGFGVLQEMRNNSKTGGALGAVSDKENAMLQANLAALEKAQSVEQARKSLRKIIEYAEGAKGRLRDAYNMKHGAVGAASPAPTEKQVVRTGTDANGRKVRQMSDGSIEYAD